MRQTHLVDYLGLNVLEYIKGPGCISEGYINAEDLERFLEKCPVVYGKTEEVPGEVQWSERKLSSDTHTARLICVSEIKREPLREDRTVNFPSSHKSYDCNGVEFGSKFAGKKCRITVEEIL